MIFVSRPEFGALSFDGLIRRVREITRSGIEPLDHDLIVLSQGSR